MPNRIEFDTAAKSVADWIGGFGNARRLSAEECAGYEARSIRQGWALDLTMDPEVESEIRILLPESFPYARPLVAVSRNRFLVWPHVEQDGVVCALPLLATIDPYRPLAVTQNILSKAVEAVKLGRSGNNVEDFRDEFHSYWDRDRTEDSPPVVSLLSDFSAPRTVSVWYGKQMIVVGDAKDAIDVWMDRQYGRPKEKRSHELGTLLSLPAALLPEQYPRRAVDLERILRSLNPRAKTLLGKQLDSGENRNLVILDAPTPNGRALAAVRLSPPSGKNMYGHKLEVLHKGFRPGRMPEGLKLHRYLASAPAPLRLKVKRADAKWVHGREHDEAANHLASKRIAIIGIGSIGSFVAELLAASGVGRITLIDPETLTFANASRHLLGVNSEGRSKALAVAELLQQRFPHHVIESHVTDGCSFLRGTTAKEESYDLILSLAGDWEFDCYLNDEYLSEDKQSRRRVLLGWAEAHAVAGHAVLLTGRDGCLSCHFSNHGQPVLNVATWKHETKVSEPACGGQFQPYGAIEIMSINSMIASLALDTLLGKLSQNAHRIYAADESRIQSTGGRETEAWKAVRSAVPADMSVTLTRPWPQRETCNRCRSFDAA